MLIAMRRTCRAAGYGIAVLLAACTLLTPAAAAVSDPPVPQPHRAVYSLALDRDRPSGDVIRAEGQYRFEWADACDVWAVEQRARLRVAYRSGEELDFGWVLSTRESKDGLSYSFALKRIGASRKLEEVEGDARMPGFGKPGTASYSSPEPRSVELPSGAVFPSTQSLELISAAKAGTLPRWWLVFDGWDDGLVEMSALLAASLPADVPAALESPLLGGPSWRLQLAFYAPEGDSTVPEQEQMLRLYANGIVDAFVFDYGDFAIDGRLVELDALPLPEC